MFVDAPPQHKKHLPHIVRVKSNQTITARLAGPPLRCYTHYTRARTQPCIRFHPDGCPLCRTVGNPRYYSYWPISGSTGVQAAVELTELAELQLLALFEDRDPPLGSLLQFHRPGGRRNNPVQVSLPASLPRDDHDRQKKVQPVPQTAIQETLFRLWEAPERLRSEPLGVYLERVEQTLYSRYSHICVDTRDSG